MTDLYAQLVAVWNTAWVHTILILMALDIVTGIAVAVYLRTFALGALADWLLTRALPYVLGDAVMQLAFMLGLGDDPIVRGAGLATIAGDAVHLFVVLALIGKLLDNLSQMGLPVPRALTDQPKQPPAKLST